MSSKRSIGIMSGISFAIIALVAAYILPYGGNPSALFHIDHVIADQHTMPSNVVILDVPSYDGAQYYQIARNMPRILNPNGWNALTEASPGSYAYQRFLLPFLAFALSGGFDAALPYAFILINILCVIGAAWLILRATQKPLYAIAIALVPAATVGLHFSLAEPLTLFLLTAFLTRFIRTHKIYALDLLLLSLIVITREVNILFIGALGLWFVLRMQWKHALLMLIPIAAFVALHGLIYGIFSEVPFLMSTDKRTLPFEAMYHLLTGGYGYNRLTLTSIPLALLFVLPSLVWTAWLLIKQRDTSFLALGSFLFLLLMTTMPDHIWGSITSIGRVITPVYPLTLMLAAQKKTAMSTYVAIVLLIIGLGAGLALSSVIHPYTLSA